MFDPVPAVRHHTLTITEKKQTNSSANNYVLFSTYPCREEALLLRNIWLAFKNLLCLLWTHIQILWSESCVYKPLVFDTTTQPQRIKNAYAYISGIPTQIKPSTKPPSCKMMQMSPEAWHVCSPPPPLRFQRRCTQFSLTKKNNNKKTTTHAAWGHTLTLWYSSESGSSWFFLDLPCCSEIKQQHRPKSVVARDPSRFW